MANIKISELPEASSFSATDQIPIVSGGATKRLAGATLDGYINNEYIEPIQRNVLGLQGTILWTNPNPTSNFSAQSVNLIESLDNFDTYSIIHRQSTSNARFLTTGKIPVGHGTFMTNPLSLNQYRGTSENTSGSTISFTAGYSANPDGSFTENNTLVIPMYVVGYKTGLF